MNLESQPDCESPTSASKNEENLAILRKTWEFASISQFIHLFNNNLKIPNFTTELLESQLIEEIPPIALLELHVKLLRILSLKKFIKIETWPLAFKKECERRNLVMSFPDSISYAQLNIIEKIRILYFLCEWQFDSSEPRFRSKNEEECFHWRVDPIGEDSEGCIYWLFDDNRMYRETPEKTKIIKFSDSPEEIAPKKRGRKPSNSIEIHSVKKFTMKEIHTPHKWELVCRTSSDWEIFPLRFENSKNSREKALFNYLSKHILPQAIPALKEKEMLELEPPIHIQEPEFEPMQIEDEISESERIQQVKTQSYFDEIERLRQEEISQFGFVKTAKLRLRPKLRDIPSEASTRETRAKRRKAPISYADCNVAPKSSRKRGIDSFDEWFFKCNCGLNGRNIDDGQPMISCIDCQVWQHIQCLENSTSKMPLSNEVLKKWESREFVCSNCEIQTDLEQNGGISDTIKSEYGGNSD